MKSDIQIAQEAKMRPILEVAEQLGLGEEDLELYGKYKAKNITQGMERKGSRGWKADTRLPPSTLHRQGKENQPPQWA